MADQPSDEDIINEAYAERLKAVFDNFVELAPSDPQGAREKFVAGVGFLRQIRVTALQALGDAGSTPDATPPADARAIPSTAKKSARKP